MSVNRDEVDYFAGISGIQLPVNEFDFGEGIILRKTYSHIMAPYLAAFKHAEPGKPHPTPWKAVSGGLSFDVQAELFIPKTLNLTGWFDRLNTIWWFLGLLRLNGFLFARVPVVSSIQFSKIPNEKEEPIFLPIEMQDSLLLPNIELKREIQITDLEWINKHWQNAGHLMNQQDSFNTAFQSLDQSIWCHTPSLALVSLWGGLEKIFSSSNQELKFRLSTTIATYLEDRGENRLELFNRIKKLYDARSRAAHGSNSEEKQSFSGTYLLLKRILIKMIENNSVPQKNELEKMVLCN